MYIHIAFKFQLHLDFLRFIIWDKANWRKNTPGGKMHFSTKIAFSLLELWTYWKSLLRVVPRKLLRSPTSVHLEASQRWDWLLDQSRHQHFQDDCRTLAANGLQGSCFSCCVKCFWPVCLASFNKQSFSSGIENWEDLPIVVCWEVFYEALIKSKNETKNAGIRSWMERIME